VYHSVKLLLPLILHISELWFFD